jgi:cell division septum initiation protein DivIVA
MTDDIVARLRERAASGVNCLCGNPACDEAADHIEKLARENAALRAERDDLRQYAKNADKAAFEIAQNYWAAQRERDSLWDELDVARAVARTAPTTGGDA